jgi:hypothetical protein
MPLKKLPIGIQAFPKIREDDFLYIDKTQMLYQMAKDAGAYFLSRPRRFGKSMLVSTLHALFEGRRELFEGLYIHDKWNWDKTHPVIRIDFAGGAIESREQLDHRIKMIFRENQHRLGVDCSFDSDMAGCFEELIRKSKAVTGQKVVILIDEYDKPILDQIEKSELSAEIREGLKNIYSVMKGMDEYIQFIFMTGVTKFSKVSIFSGINQLEDITLDHRYATICGYTQNDLETSFAQHLAGVDWEKLKCWYNGYSFTGESVYNPFDILLFISKGKEYRSYWFETGSPSFLLKLFKKECYFLPELSDIEVGEEILDSFDVDQINPITLLFQAGYLTIDCILEKRGHIAYRLRVPNEEVYIALHRHFITGYLPITSVQVREKALDNLYDDLCAGNLMQLKQHIQSLFAGVAWRNFTNNALLDSEGYYASVLYAFFASLNAVIIPEDISNHGQADMTIILGEHIYVMEIKLDPRKRFIAKTPNPALAQIIERDYANKYRTSGKAVHQVGMVFHNKTRNLVQMDWLDIA